MTLYTGKGDDGTTKTFGCNQRISKSSNVTEALGALDEINSFLGLIKVKTVGGSVKMEILGDGFDKIANNIQQNLFIIQAEVAGSDMTIAEEKLRECENYANEGEKILPPIKNFFISGGTEMAVLCDISRTMARRAERRVIAIVDEGDESRAIGKWTLAYLNRLSSLLYVMARLANHFNGLSEDAPTYK
jgi:cob(I)alamin adenosyltransferase